MNRKTTGVRYLNVKYNVNEKKKVVTCCLTFGLNLKRIPYAVMLCDNDCIFDLFNKEFEIRWYEDENGEANPYVTTQIVAFANCSPEDEFDVELGKKIALTRAQSGAFDTAAYIYDTIQNELLNIANAFDVRVENCIESIQKCNDHVDYLITEKYGEVNS
jgi:hypothetical protein